MGRDDLDVYESGVDRGAVGRAVLRVLGVLVGIAIGVCGFAFFALRCFDTCPSDPSLDKVIQLLGAAGLLLGPAVVTEAVSFRTRWSAPASVVVFAGGLLGALCGTVSLALIPSIEDPGGGGGSAAFAGAALLVGGALAVLRRPRRRASPPPTD